MCKLWLHVAVTSIAALCYHGKLATSMMLINEQWKDAATIMPCPSTLTPTFLLNMLSDNTICNGILSLTDISCVDNAANLIEWAQKYPRPLPHGSSAAILQLSKTLLTVCLNIVMMKTASGPHSLTGHTSLSSS